MVFRRVALILLVVFAACPLVSGAAVAAPPPQQQAALAGQRYGEEHRAVRRDIPLTDAIVKAMEAGTRDFTGRPGPEYWQLETDYSIDVSLDPATATLTGSESIQLHNNSPDTLDQILLRLDHNIFRERMPLASPWRPAEITDGMVVTRITVNGDVVDLNPPAGGRQGRGGGRGAPPRLAASGLDQTVARITLVDPIPARSTAAVEIDWHTKLPGGDTGRAHRMTQRWDHTLFQPTQWYPRIAKYDDLRGWDDNLYLGPSEFYNNFGRFDVRINVPAGWVVSGTGLLQNPEEVLTAQARQRLATVLDTDDVVTIVGADEVGPGRSTAPGDRLTWHMVADRVNDFAWATAEHYVWQALRADIPEKGYVPINMVFLPERANLFTNAGAISRHALEYYSKLWIPYPFPQLTLQDGPSAGMEYPMVINSNQGAADHEAGHQWWPMMVGNNETWYGWMDEGFNQYMNILSNADRRGTEPELDGRGQSYGRISGNEWEPTMMWVANYDGPMYSFETYSKTPLMLSMLGGIVGDEEVQAAHREYTRTWAFKHPSPWDYAFFMSNALDRDLGWFWYYWLFTTDSVDGSIQNVVSSGGRSTVTVRQDGEMPSPVVLRVELAASGPAVQPMDNAEMIGDTTAIVTWPVDVWFDGSRTFDAVLDFGGRSIESVTFDPFGRFPDRNPADNVWPR
ncbi:MAG: M1 family metallopeptidase [Acidobacteriota bacterium]|jgi:hypothetical protein